MYKKRIISIFSYYILPLLLIIVLLSTLKTYPSNIFNLFGNISLLLLFILLSIKPLSIILPQYSTLKKILQFQRELAIIIVYFAYAHGLPYLYFIQTKQWNYSLLGVYIGIFSLLILLILYITSSQYLIIKMKKWGKLTYNIIFFIFFLILLHIITIKSFKGEHMYILLGIVVIILKILEKKKIQLS